MSEETRSLEVALNAVGIKLFHREKRLEREWTEVDLDNVRHDEKYYRVVVDPSKPAGAEGVVTGMLVQSVEVVTESMKVSIADWPIDETGTDNIKEIVIGTLFIIWSCDTLL